MTTALIVLGVAWIVTVELRMSGFKMGLYNHWRFITVVRRELFGLSGRVNAIDILQNAKSEAEEPAADDWDGEEEIRI